MTLLLLLILGLCLGSFINALIWRIHEQHIHNGSIKVDKQFLSNLSIIKGHSMCPNCKHRLAVRDLVPLISWVCLKGKCRYCRKSISAQYPIVELLTTGLFIASYIWWPVTLHGYQVAIFILWLLILVGLVALFVYDIRWLLLPNRIVYPVSVIALAIAIINIVESDDVLRALINTLLAVAIGGGIFYVLFQVSSGKWIGGGDVKLGWMLGLIVGTPGRSLLLIFLASLIGSLSIIPLLMTKRLKKSSVIPFGPFLILGAIIVQLFGVHILNWYQHTFLTF